MSHSIGGPKLLCFAGIFFRLVAAGTWVFPLSRPSTCVSFLKADQFTTVSSVNNSSLSLSYNIPASAANFSTNYLYGDCANATAVSTTYSTITSDDTTTVSTIAPSVKCCTKCEIGAEKVCY